MKLDRKLVGTITWKGITAFPTGEIDNAQIFGTHDDVDGPPGYDRRQCFPANYGINRKSGESVQRRKFGIPAHRAQSSSMALLTATLVDLLC